MQVMFPVFVKARPGTPVSFYDTIEKEQEELDIFETTKG